MKISSKAFCKIEISAVQWKVNEIFTSGQENFVVVEESFVAADENLVVVDSSELAMNRFGICLS